MVDMPDASIASTTLNARTQYACAQTAQTPIKYLHVGKVALGNVMGLMGERYVD